MAEELIVPTVATPIGVVLAPIIQLLNYVGEITILLGQSVKELFRRGVGVRELIAQMNVLGVSSVPIAILTNFASGAVLALYFAPFLAQYGVASFTGGIVALAMSRELAPVLTGIVVAARAGSAIAAEIGTMRVTEQIDALRALAVSPVQYLVLPRIVAAVLMLPVVCVLADSAGIFGGYVVATKLGGVPGPLYINSIRDLLVPADFYLGLVKTVFFGLILSTVGCHQGLNTRGGATEVGRATTSAVVIAIVLIYIADFFLADVMFAGH